MAYLIPQFCLEDLNVYNATRKYRFVNEVFELEDKHRFEMTTNGNVEEYLPLVITVKHSKVWFEEVKFFGTKRNVYIPALTITIKLDKKSQHYKEDLKTNFKNETLLLTDKILLNDHVGFGLDLKSLLLGGSQGKYKMSYNGLNAVLESMRVDDDRLINFTLDEDLTTYAERGFLDRLLKFRKEFGNFDFVEIV